MKLSHAITCAFAVACAGLCLPSVAADGEGAEQSQPAEADPALKEELDFVKALIESSMPDLAAPVIDAAKKKWPAAAPKLKVYEMQGSLSLGRFDVVQKEIDALKGQKGREAEYWALRLAMADAYYGVGKMDECRKIYNEFFKAVPKPGPALLDFFVESGFRWAQICTREKHFDEAVRMYGGLLAALSDKDFRWSNVALEAVELLLRQADDIPADPKGKQAAKRAALLKQATGYVDKLLWKIDDPLVFGKAIAMKAHVEMLHGRTEKAQSLVNDYMPQLSEIHRALMDEDPDGSRGYVRASPMPECRYLLAKMLWNTAKAEAKKPKADEDLIKDSLFGARGKNRKRNGLGAYNHALNVYVKYVDSVWAADAADLAEEIEAFAKERYQKEIRPKTIPPELREKAHKMRFQNAYNLFRGQEYEKAIEAYEKVLASGVPDSKDTVNARGVVAECYVNLRQNAKKGSPEHAKFEKAAQEAEDFLASQYKGKEEALVRAAGNQTLRLASMESDLRMRARAQALHDAYFANYPEHFNAPQTAFLLASRAFQAEDWETVVRYAALVVEKYPKSPKVLDALNYLVSSNAKMGNVAEQVRWLREYVKAEKKAGARTTAQLNLALIQQKQAFATFDAADETNDVAVAAAMRKKANASVVGSIRDFRAAADDLAKALETGGKALDAKERDLYLLRREQAIFLEAASWQRLMRHADEKLLPKIRGFALKAYQKYLDAYPKGQYAPSSLVKVGTIYTAESKRATDGNDAQLASECMKKSQDAFARLQKDFPESDEAKNSLPRLAKTLIEMGLKRDGASVYRKMLEAENGKYTAGQFLQAGHALLEAKLWQDANDAYAKTVDMASSLTNSAAYLVPALFGQARAAKGAKNYAEARQRLDDFIEKYGKSSLVTNAYDMLVDVALEMARNEKDDAQRMHAFNAAFGSLKKLRPYTEKALEQAKDELAGLAKAPGGGAGQPAEAEARLSAARRRVRSLQGELDSLDLRSSEVLLTKLQAEANLPDEAAKTRRRAVVSLTTYLMAHDPYTINEGVKAFRRKFASKDEYEGKSPEEQENLLTAEQCRNLEYCYGKLLPLMVEQGLGRQEVEPYFDRYMELFGDGGAAGKGDHYDDVNGIRGKVKGN